MGGGPFPPALAADRRRGSAARGRTGRCESAMRGGVLRTSGVPRKGKGGHKGGGLAGRHAGQDSGR
eukprot:3958600-Lingulodinium_polyedra.AAC.1